MANKPRIRFRGFTEDWEQRKLIYIFNDFIVPMRDKPKVFSGTTPWTRIEDIEGRYINTSLSGQFVSDETIKSMNLKVIPKGSLIVSASATFGVVAIVNNDLITNQTFIGLVPNKDFDIDFLYSLFEAPTTKGKLLKLSAGSTIFYIARESFENLVLSVPSKEEQIKISKVFKSIDDSITLHQCKLKKLNLAKKSLLQKLFPRNGSQIPGVRFKGFTDAWEQRKLGDIATFSKGNGYSKSDLSASGNPIILYGRLYTNYETTIRNVDTFVELKDKSVISQGGEVIVPASGETAEDISRASVVKNQGVIIGGDLNVIKVNSLLDPTFLALTISNGEQQKELSKRAQGKSVVHLHNSDLQEVNLIFPLLNEQKEISTIFEKMDNIITLHQRKLERLQEVKKGLLQKMFV